MPVPELGSEQQPHFPHRVAGRPEQWSGSSPSLSRRKCQHREAAKRPLASLRRGRGAGRAVFGCCYASGEAEARRGM